MDSEREVSYMTQIGLGYLQHMETTRANKANEALKEFQNTETARHNVETERYSWSELEFRGRSLDETVRSNLARESETYRSNVAREAEAHRSARAQEDLGWATLSERDIANRRKDAEQKRTNKAREEETERANKAREDNERYSTNLYNMGTSGATYIAHKDIGMTSGDAFTDYLTDRLFENAFQIMKFVTK